MSTACRPWRLEPWCAIRVTGLPASILTTLRLHESPRLARRLAAVERELQEARSVAANAMFDLVRGCVDAGFRRAALDAKRTLFSGRRLQADMVESLDRGLPDDARSIVAKVVSLEEQQSVLSRHFECTLARERAAVSEALRRVLENTRLLTGILLSGADHLATARKLAAIPAGATLTSSQQLRESTVARYVFRAATRTTPFSGFAATSLARLDDATAAPPRVEWRSAPQLDLRYLAPFLARAGAARLPHQSLRVSPLRSPMTGPEPAVVFSRLARDTAGGGALEWSALGWSDTTASLLEAADGRTLDDAARLLAGGEDGRPFRDALLELVDAGLIEVAGTPVDAAPAGIRAVADALETNRQGQDAGALRDVAEALDAFAGAGIEERHALVTRISAQVSPGSGDPRPPVLEDVTLDGLTTADLPITPDALVAELAPVLRLVRASACNAAHRLMCAAFVQRFGRSGVCRDVGAFIADLLRHGDFLSRIRVAQEPIRWLTSELGRVVAAAEETDRVSVEPALFDALVGPDGPFATALFIQCAGIAPGPDPCLRVVVNGAQAGRGKYLSRYLGTGADAVVAALGAIRHRLARTDGPLPVEIAPTLDLNFQIHPPLTDWRLETPWEPAHSRTGILPLTDLTVRFDPDAGELKTYSRQLDRDVDPIHLGFLRDSALPDPHFLLRALSPRLREDSVAERADVYNVLDRLMLARNEPLVPHRPRLEVGRVVFERERWAVPAGLVPCRGEKQSYAEYFRAVSRFRCEHQLPARAFIRYVGQDAAAFGLAETRLYVDWESPLTLSSLTRFARRNHGQANGYVVLTEVLPEPETSWLRINEEAHAAELVVEFETGGYRP